MTVAQIRRELKDRIDHMSERKLQSVADYAAYIDDASGPAAKAKVDSAEQFDPQQQERVFGNIMRIREQLIKRGVSISHEEIRAAIEDGRM